MPQQVLPFFGTEMHDRFAVTRALRPVREVPYVGKEISPLRGQQMNQIETFPLAFQYGRGGRKKVDVRVGAGPIVRAKIGET